MPSAKTNTMLITLAVITASAIGFLSFSRRRKIIQVSKAFIGQQEKSGNTGFQSAEMERLMKEVGWHSGDAWCVYFAKLMWYYDAPQWLKPRILTAISGNSQQTWARVNSDPAFVVSNIPRSGDLVIWQNYKNGVGQTSGHAGIVKRMNVNDFFTIEGNSNISGGSEGYEVVEKVRKYNFENNNGLRLKGFVRFA